MSLFDEMREYRRLPWHEKEIARGWMRENDKWTRSEIALSLVLLSLACCVYLAVLYRLDLLGPRNPGPWYGGVVPFLLGYIPSRWAHAWRLRLQWLRLRKRELAEREDRVVPGSETY